ncbi:hypothetical protein C2S51_016910 [Perilla frutescens var. frutescens]|nr:hypothetical protein C2S51_016910 [Perilla frutescens var. frutescens]
MQQTPVAKKRDVLAGSSQPRQSGVHQEAYTISQAVNALQPTTMGVQIRAPAPMRFHPNEVIGGPSTTAKRCLEGLKVFPTKKASSPKQAFFVVLYSRSECLGDSFEDFSGRGQLWTASGSRVEANSSDSRLEVQQRADSSYCRLCQRSTPATLLFYRTAAAVVFSAVDVVDDQLLRCEVAFVQR